MRERCLLLTWARAFGMGNNMTNAPRDAGCESPAFNIPYTDQNALVGHAFHCLSYPSDAAGDDDIVLSWLLPITHITILET